MPSKSVIRAREMRKAMTPPELALWMQLRQLRAHGWHFRRQSPEGPYTLDFVCRRRKLVVEVDGVQHATSEQSEHDQRRDAFLRSRGFRILRFWASDVERELEGVMQAIQAALGQPPTSSSIEAPAIKGGSRYRALVRLGLRPKA